jgi:hypothetical protein
MFIEATLSHRNLLNEGNQVTHFHTLLCLCENFCDSILLRFRSAKANSYGSYGSSSGPAIVPQGTGPKSRLRTTLPRQAGALTNELHHTPVNNNRTRIKLL